MFSLELAAAFKFLVGSFKFEGFHLNSSLKISALSILSETGSREK
jgi:hypothetical protein